MLTSADSFGLLVFLAGGHSFPSRITILIIELFQLEKTLRLRSTIDLTPPREKKQNRQGAFFHSLPSVNLVCS